MIVKLIDALRQKKPLLKTAGLALLILLIAADGLFVSKEHAHTALEQYPGFWSAFGIVAALALVMASKCLEAYDVMTREDYYDK
jgi:hypothetical protein